MHNICLLFLERPCRFLVYILYERFRFESELDNHRQPSIPNGPEPVFSPGAFEWNFPKFGVNNFSLANKLLKPSRRSFIPVIVRLQLQSLPQAQTYSSFNPKSNRYPNQALTLMLSQPSTHVQFYRNYAQ